MSQEEDLKRIADALERVASVYSDPQAFMDRVENQVREMLSRVNVPVPIMPSQAQAVEGQAQAVEGAGPPSPALITGVEVKLSDDERKAICERAMVDFEEQMAEFKDFISQALSELPAGTLKRIDELMKKGEKFKLRRRHGCIYLDFGHGDDDFYLRM